MLARTPVVGVKSILDVPATLEYLETAGVPVVGFRTLRFPGFYLADSRSPLDWSVESEEAARVIRTLPEVGLERSRLVVANPLISQNNWVRVPRLPARGLDHRGGGLAPLAVEGGD